MIKLCQGCVDDLQEYNPYIDECGNTIPVEKLDILLVHTIEECDNYKLGR